MSCKHGNHPDACDTCNEIDEAYKSGVADGKQAAIAAQEPKQAMTDGQISDMAADYLTAYQYASGAHYEGEVEFARAILAAAKKGGKNA